MHSCWSWCLDFETDWLRILVPKAVRREHQSGTTRSSLSRRFRLIRPRFCQQVPVVTVQIANQIVPNVLLDGGSGVNVLSESMCAWLGILRFESAPFAVKMADQRRVQPLGIVRHCKIKIATLRFGIAAVVLRMEDIQEAYPLLLGRPWLRQAKAKHNWETDVLAIRQGKRKIKLAV